MVSDDDKVLRNCTKHNSQMMELHVRFILAELVWLILVPLDAGWVDWTHWSVPAWEQK